MTGWRKRQVMIPAKEIGGELWISAADHHQAIKEALAQPEYWGGVDFDIKTTPPQRTWVGLTDEELINVKKDAERYRWLRKEYAESRETYLAECVPSESSLDEYIDRQIAKTSIKTERWSGK